MLLCCKAGNNAHIVAVAYYLIFCLSLQESESECSDNQVSPFNSFITADPRQCIMTFCSKDNVNIC